MLRLGNCLRVIGFYLLAVISENLVFSPITWTDINGGTQQVTISTSSPTLRTNFGCTGVSELNTTSYTPINTLTFPDSTSIGITYEPTPQHSPYITGRVQQITLREGGTVSYTYGGAHNGIDCKYQTVHVLTRTLGNGDTTTYTLTHNLFNGYYNAVNKVVYPNNNESDYTFTGFTSTDGSPTYAQVVTQVLKYQGNCSTSCALLTTDLYSYNTAYTSAPSASTIANAQVTLPVKTLISRHS